MKSRVEAEREHAEEPGDDERSAPFTIRAWHVACLLIVVLLGGFLRFHRIDATSVWCDELLSIHHSSGHGLSVDDLPRGVLIENVPDYLSLANARPWWKVWSGLDRDVHPPLYYVTLRAWRSIFGDAPTAIRSLSALLGTLAIVAAAVAGREAVGTAAGLAVSLLNALASNAIFYAQEARMYALALLCTSVVIALTLRIGRLGFTRRRGVALGASALLAMLTLYLSFPVLLAACIYVLLVLRGRDRWGTFLSFCAAGIVFAICWLPFFLGQTIRDANTAWLAADPAGHLATTVGRALRLPMDQFGVPLASSRAFAYAFAIVYVLPAFFLRRRPALMLPWLATVLVVAMPAVADALRTTNMLDWPRYTVLLIPPASIAIVGMAWQMRQRWARLAVPGALALFSALSIGATYELQRYDFRGIARVAEQARAESGGQLIFATTWNEKFNSVLLLTMQYYWQQPPTNVVMVESLSDIARLPRDLAADRVVLIAGDRPADPVELPDYQPAGRSTWALGAGSVHALARRPSVSDDDTTSRPVR